jgi:hypothetical protein
MKPNLKKAVIEALIAHFEAERSGLVESARAAHSASTHEESRAEDRHDTFAIEAGYLAAGQAARVQDLDATLAEFRAHLESSLIPDSAKPGTLVALSHRGRQLWFFLARHGGGTKTLVDSISITVLSPDSPLGENLFDLKAGDGFSVDSKTGVQEYSILEVL